MIIDTRHGDIVEWARLGSGFVEIFDVALIAATRACAVIAPDSPEMQGAITSEDASEAFPAAS